MTMSDEELIARYLDLQEILRQCGGQTPTAVSATVAFERELLDLESPLEDY
jgi:hypothetical protein